MEEVKKDKIIIITGATAIGKSGMAVDLALKLGGEIISADSMQIYKKMDIGTGKISKEETKGVPHHLIDILDPHEEYSAGQYVLDCRKALLDITSRGKIPIIVGGTGLYINALINGHNFADAPKDEEMRNELKRLADEKGSVFIHNMLKEKDAKSADAISPNDLKRIIRALEIYKLTGKPKSQAAKIESQNFDYDYLLLVLEDDRQNLYRKIENRVEKMLSLGLIQEVKNLNLACSCQSMQAIGYKETALYLDGQITLKELEEKIKINSRHYAKRQMTYFKNMPLKKEFVPVTAEPLIHKALADFIKS